jgi:DNA polymerase I-like protein with 3'-5' exonuclease and polymerase domains
MARLKEHYIIEDEETLKELDTYLADYEDLPMALDTETDGLHFFARDIGICISVDPEIGFYIPTRVFNGTELVETPLRSKLLPYFQKWFLKPRRHLVMHNAGFDCRIMMNNFGLKLINLVLADTRLLFKMTVSEDDPSALKDLGVKYLNENAKDEQKDLEDSVKKNGGKWLKDFKEFFRGDMHVLAKYGAKDPCLTLSLFNLWYPILLNDPQLKLLWEEETLPLMELVFIMNTTGFPIDIPHFQNMKTEIEKEILQLETEIIKELKPLIKDYEAQLILDKTKIGRNVAAKRIAAVMDFDMKNLTLEQERILKEAVYKEDNGDNSIFNLGSPKDLRWLIYTRLQEPVTKKTPKGEPSTDSDVIESLATRHDWAKKLVEKKKNEKLLSTYVEGALSENINGLTYFEFDQGATISGRFATRGGIPIMTLPKKDKRIKAGFVAPKGYKIVSADFNSLEPHLAAYISQDPALIDCFVSGKDFYSVIGIKQFNKADATPYKDGTPNSFPVKYPDLRDLVKTYALASLYGAEEHRIAEIIHPEALTWKDRSKAKAEAGNLLDGYFSSFPGTRQMIDQSHKEACLYGQVRTKFGRIRHMPFAKEIYSKYGNQIKDYQWAKMKGLTQERREFKNLLNNSVNIKIQGLAAHCTNRAMINTKRMFDFEGLDAWVCMQIHDEIVCIAHEDQAERAKQILEKCMSDCVDLSPIKLKAEAHIGNNLAEVK